VNFVEMKSLVMKLLGPPEEIGICARSHNRAHRWMIFGNQHFKVFLHHSPNDASSGGLSLYPERLISIGLEKLHTRKSSGASHVSGNREAWMVLIAKSVHGPENTSHS
jgi:hypothetical protein